MNAKLILTLILLVVLCIILSIITSGCTTYSYSRTGAGDISLDIKSSRNNIQAPEGCFEKIEGNKSVKFCFSADSLEREPSPIESALAVGVAAGAERAVSRALIAGQPHDNEEN